MREPGPKGVSPKQTCGRESALHDVTTLVLVKRPSALVLIASRSHWQWSLWVPEVRVDLIGLQEMHAQVEHALADLHQPNGFCGGNLHYMM